MGFLGVINEWEKDESNYLISRSINRGYGWDPWWHPTVDTAEGAEGASCDARCRKCENWEFWPLGRKVQPLKQKKLYFPT